MTQSRGWQSVGQAVSVFELAEGPQQADDLLTEHPLLLLVARRGALHITSRGVWILGQNLSTRPEANEIVWEWLAGERTYVIHIGPHHLRTPRKPRDLVAELESWLQFYFGDFLPRLPTSRRPISEPAQKMWQTLLTACPECNRPLVPCEGDVGIAVR
jgi:hypothetical protein